MGSNKDGIIAAEVNGRLDDLFGDDGEEQGDNFGNRSTEAENPSGDLVGGEEEQDVVELNGGSASHFESGAWEEEGEGEEIKMNSENSLINDLKSVILSLEWEISDEVMQKLGEEIEKLKVRCKDDKIIVAFLQLLDSLGKYIQKKKADSHPDSISLLNSVFENLEKVTASPDMNEATKKKLLVNEVNKYKKLKDIIMGKPDSSPKQEEKTTRPPDHGDAEEEVGVSKPISPRVPPTVRERSVVDDDDDDDEPIRTDRDDSQQDTVAHLLKEIHRTIQSEFKALREELKRWRERQ